MNALAVDIAQYLEDQGFGTQAATTGWAVFVNRMVDQPITCIGVFETPSPSPTTPMNKAATGTKPFEICMFQVRVRGASDSAVWTKIKAIADKLNGLKQWSVSNGSLPATKYSHIIRTSDFLPLSSQGADAFERSVNFAAYRQEQVS